MKKILVTSVLIAVMISSTSASFLFQETDPYCTITGTTHTSFPGEVSDTSSWSIPTAYQGECDETPELSQGEKERINDIMVQFFTDKDFTGPIYGGNDINSYGGDNSLNPDGQAFVKDKFFPAVTAYINKERQKYNPNMTNIAVLNEAVKTVGYDYFIGDR